MSIVNFEHVIAGWVYERFSLILEQKKLPKVTGVIFINGNMVQSVSRDFENPCRRNLYHLAFTKFNSNRQTMLIN